jgi:peptidoglycan/xylan/chitin deacetylase (PgdA/CDA1 family)
VALPWLERFDYPAVLFMPTDYVGGRNTFDEGIEPEERMCDWDELCDLQRAGVSIQSHGASHRWFSKLTTVEQDKELTRSKAALEENLGSRVEIIAFPFGDPGDMLRESASSLRSAGYRAACMYGGGPVSLPTANPYHLSRLAMGPDTNLEIELASKTQNVPPPSTLFDR